MTAKFQLEILDGYPDAEFTALIRDLHGTLLVQDGDDHLHTALANVAHRFAELLDEQPQVRLALHEPVRLTRDIEGLRLSAGVPGVLLALSEQVAGEQPTALVEFIDLDTADTLGYYTVPRSALLPLSVYHAKPLPNR